MAMMGVSGVRTGPIMASQDIIMAYLLGREDSFLRQMRSEVYGAQWPVNSRYVSDELL